ncbi:MAG: MG2 domain-containing protein [Rikenellaceae bacterium]
MKRHLWLIVSLLLISTGAFAKRLSKKEQKKQAKIEEQAAAEVDLGAEFAAKSFDSFTKFYKSGINEKLYIQTDKPYYSAGEQVWFKGFLRNSITHLPTTLSKFIYVELIDKKDSLLTRVKVRADEAGFHNSITLPAAIDPGEYVLKGYSLWMANWGNDFLFYRKINVANPIDDAVTLNSTYSKNDKGETVVRVKVLTNTATSTANMSLDCSYYVGDRLRTGVAKVKSDGVAEFTLPAGLSRSSLDIVSTDDKHPFSKTIHIPILEDKIDVQFFAEGGDLIARNLQTVVFKAVGADGLSRELKGELHSVKEGKLFDIETSFKGMGRFNLMSDQGDEYYAVLHESSEPNNTMKVSLPKPATSGCAVKAVMSRDRLLYQMIATPDIDPQKVAFVIHSRGKIISSHKVGNAGRVNSVELKYLPDGIATVSIVEMDGYKPLAERLVFVAHPHVTTTIKSNRPSYGRREKVNLTINLRDSLGGDIVGDYAIAVTNSSNVNQDKSNDNIVSNMLLTSDIKGYVEGAGDYFTSDAKKDYANRELLLLTQGWKRFDLGGVLRDSIRLYKSYPEEHQVIAGYVEGFFGKGAKNAKIIVLNPKTKFFDAFPLEESSNFRFELDDVPDSTSLTLQAVSKGGSGTALTLNILPEVFAEPNYPFLQPLIGREDNVIPDSYVMQSKEKYYYEGGMKVFDMEAVEVTARKKKVSSSVYGATPDHSMESKELSMMPGKTVFEVVQTFPGVQLVDSDSLSIRGASVSPLVFIDDVKMDYTYLTMILVDQVETLSIVIAPESNVYGLGSDGGVIVVELKDGADIAAATPASPAMAIVSHLGYKKPSAYYQPKYDNPVARDDKKPDLRTTLCWDPAVKVDSLGVANVSFFTADRITGYDVVFEGITKDGRVVRATHSIEK